MANGRLMFRKVGPPPDTGGGPQAPRDGEPPAPGRGSSFARAFGALKGTVTIIPATDLTDPVGEDWDAGPAHRRAGRRSRPASGSSRGRRGRGT